MKQKADSMRLVATFVTSSIALYGVLCIICFAAWITHVIFCLQDGRWGFLIAGALVVPIAIIHGIGLWFGVFH